MAKIIGTGAPTKNTPGQLGQEYFDKSTKTVYTCTDVKHKTSLKSGEMDEEFEWTVISGADDLKLSDLENDLFYAEEDTVLFDEDVSLTGSGAYYGYSFPTPLPIKPNTLYRVTMNNASFRATTNGIGSISMTNPAGFGGYVSVDKNGLNIDYPDSNVKSGRLTITELGAVKTIEPQYLPGPYVIESAAELPNPEEVLRAFFHGRPIYVRYQDSTYMVVTDVSFYTYNSGSGDPNNGKWYVTIKYGNMNMSGYCDPNPNLFV